MLEYGLAERQSLGYCRPDIIRSQIVHECVFHQKGHDREGADHISQKRQKGVPDDIDMFTEK